MYYVAVASIIGSNEAIKTSSHLEYGQINLIINVIKYLLNIFECHNDKLYRV